MFICYIFKNRFAFQRFSKKRPFFSFQPEMRLMSPSYPRSRRFHRLSSAISRRQPSPYFISLAEIPRAFISE